MLPNNPQSAKVLLADAEACATFREIIEQIVYDHAPRAISLGNADQMVDSIVFQIQTGTLISIVPFLMKNKVDNGGGVN